VLLAVGNKETAVELLGRSGDYWSAVKLWADMGEIDKALKLCETDAADPDGINTALTCMPVTPAGRWAISGRFAVLPEVVALPVLKSRTVGVRCTNRAKASIEAIQLFELSTFAACWMGL